MRSCQKLSQCPTEPTPAGSRMGLTLDKAEPISDGGSASGVAYLGREKSHCATAAAARERSESM